MAPTKTVSIRQCFAEVPDPRREHLRLHNLWEIIAITILGVVAGADSWVEVAKYGTSKRKFLRTFLDLANGIPSHDTFGRVFALVNPVALQAGFVQWVQAIAWVSENRLLLGQQACDAKSNEITAIPELIKNLEIAGSIVTIDAMGCQTDIAATIREASADYVLAVKDNQPTLHADIRQVF